MNVTSISMNVTSLSMNVTSIVMNVSRQPLPGPLAPPSGEAGRPKRRYEMDTNGFYGDTFSRLYFAALIRSV